MHLKIPQGVNLFGEEKVTILVLTDKNKELGWSNFLKNPEKYSISQWSGISPKLMETTSRCLFLKHLQLDITPWHVQQILNEYNLAYESRKKAPSLDSTS